MPTKKNTSKDKPVTKKKTEEENKVIEETDEIQKIFEGESKEKTNIKKHTFVNFMIVSLLIISLISFVLVIINKSASIITLISSLLLTIFIISYSVVSITYKRNNKSMILLGSILLIAYFIINIINPTTTSSTIMGIPNFSGKSITEVMKWASKNKVSINQEYEYSDMIEEYHVISQKNKSKNELTVSVSEGANPSKEIIVPSMIGWDAERVLKFIKNNYLSNVIVNFEVSDKVKDTVINQSTSGNLKRDDELTLTFSYGESDEFSEVKLIDFTNKSKFEVEFYMKQNKLRYSFDDEFNSKIKRGYATKQSIAAGEVISDSNTGIVITISKGPEIKVPDLTKFNMTEITEWAIKNKVKLNFSDKYDAEVKENNIISASVNNGDIIEQGTIIKVILSRGSLKMPKFNDIKDFYDWANKYEINYEEIHEFSDTVKAGEVISYSYKTGETIKNGDTIKVKISDGAKKTVPNVVGLTKSNASKKLENAGLNYSFVYKNSKETKDKVLSQSISAGSEVSKNTTVVLTLSNGKAPSGGGSTQTPTPTPTPTPDPTPTPTPTPTPEPEPDPTPTCESYNIRFSMIGSILDQYDGKPCSTASSGLKSGLESQFPGLKVNVSCKSADGYSTNEVISGFKGGTTDSCSTISIVLAN